MYVSTFRYPHKYTGSCILIISYGRIRSCVLHWALVPCDLGECYSHMAVQCGRAWHGAGLWTPVWHVTVSAGVTPSWTDPSARAHVGTRGNSMEAGVRKKGTEPAAWWGIGSKNLLNRCSKIVPEHQQGCDGVMGCFFFFSGECARIKTMMNCLHSYMPVSLMLQPCWGILEYNLYRILKLHSFPKIV